jgi:hypothetical protein
MNKNSRKYCKSLVEVWNTIESIVFVFCYIRICSCAKVTKSILLEIFEKRKIQV